MSNFLWGLGELVNDPSSTLISTLQKHLFTKSIGNDTIITTETISRRVSNNNSIVSNNKSLHSTQGATSSRKLDKSPSKSKCVQVGALRKPRALSTQCSAILYEKSNKATSVPQVPYYDRSCTTAVVEKKDAVTEPKPNKICDDHKHALNTLRKWPATMKALRTKETKQNKVIVLRDKFLDFLNLFKLEKIQSVPRYRGTDMEITKLFKSVSLDEVSNLSEVKQQTVELI